MKEKESRSDLPQDLYSRIQFMEVLEDLQADAVNQLAFDDQLGFVNFNIDLNNAVHGGITIVKEDDWQRVAVLNFKVKDKTTSAIAVTGDNRRNILILDNEQVAEC